MNLQCSKSMHKTRVCPSQTKIPAWRGEVGTECLHCTGNNQNRQIHGDRKYMNIPETRGRSDQKEITGNDVISSGFDESVVKLLVVHAFPSL